MNKLKSYIALIPAACLLCGCYTARKATKQVVKAQAHHPEVVSELCGRLYPPVTMVKDSIVYKEGSIQYLPSDTIAIDCDTVRSQSVVRIPCPPCLYRVDSFHHYTERQVENTARLTALQYETRTLQSRYDKLSVKNTLLMWWAIAATALLATSIFFKIYKPF